MDAGEPVVRSSFAPLLEAIDGMADDPGGTVDSAAPDRRDGRVYRASDAVRMAIKLAVVTRRPLLLRGDPGSGKSSLAAYVARNLGWRYYEHVVTSRTQARDLLWTYDTVRRFADAASAARTGQELYNFDYVEPGVLWWVMNPASARLRGAPEANRLRAVAVDPNEPVNSTRDSRNAIVLLDEIDKADPDMPNALLVPLGSTEFEVSETETPVRPPRGTSGDIGESPRMLVIVTTNEERELPEAFVRRCVVHRLEHPDAPELVEIARAHFRALGVELDTAEIGRATSIADRLIEMRRLCLERGSRPPSTAEYLDAVHAGRALGLELGAADWNLVESLILDKERLDHGVRRQDAQGA